MWVLLLVTIITVLGLIYVVIFKPEIRVRKIHIETFWLVSVLGAILLFALGFISLDSIIFGITDSGSINPLKILVIFLSMTILSIVLDELGFFKKLAFYTLQKAKTKQIRIFIYLYVTISLLTIFTSNDIIILTFTPFICYFTKNAKINPIPYLISEFVAANTWSMMLIIGNPTNIYLASIYNADFLSYFVVMVFPTIVSAVSAFGILFLVFRKELAKPAVIEEVHYQLRNRKLVIIALIHLVLCTVLLTISSYLGLEMWYICITFAISILLILLSVEMVLKKQKPQLFFNTVKRTPWSLIPFLLSMFIIVLALSENGITQKIAYALNGIHPVYGYGISSFLFANIINNIPMTVLFSDLIRFSSEGNLQSALYSSVIGSNIGAYLTPIGALAGIMWMRILKREGIPLSFPKFVKYGILIAVPSILIALYVLSTVI